MVIIDKPGHGIFWRLRQRGSLLMEAMVAIAIVAAVLIPLSVSVYHEQVLCRAYYYRAVAMEIVDGEMEILAAGGWRSFSPGTYAYTVQAEASKNLPPGRFELTLTTRSVRLEWLPAGKDKGGKVWREVKRQ